MGEYHRGASPPHTPSSTHEVPAVCAQTVFRARGLAPRFLTLAV